MAAAGVHHLYVNQGATLDETFTLKDKDGNARNLTNFSAVAKGKNAPGGSTVYFNAASGDADDDRIVITPLTGEVRLVLKVALTSALTAPLEGVWDLFITDTSAPAGEGVERVLGGKLFIVAGVSHD